MKKPLLNNLVFFLIFFAVSQGSAITVQVATYEGLLQAIRETRAASQARIEAAAEQEKVREAWETGKLIDEHILQHKERADYDKEVMLKLARDLETSESELYRMLKFARLYPKVAPGPELSWSHYRALVAIDDPNERGEIIKQAAEEHWSRDQVRTEVRRRNSAADSRQRNEGITESKLSEIMPGPLNTYQIIRLKDRLKIDLGFGAYFDLSEKDASKFKEGDIVTLEKGKLQRRTASTLDADAAVVAQPAQLFTYTAIVTGVVDGDTFHALVDLGFGVTLAQRVRLRRVDAAEIITAEGKEAKAYLEKILSRDQGRIILRSRELDQHGRPIADVWVKGKPVDQELLDQGLVTTLNNAP